MELVFYLSSDAAVGGFCERLEDICNRVEIPSDDRDEMEWAPLTQSDLKALVNEIMSIRSKNLLHIVPVDNLSRILKVLDHQIHRAEGLSIDDCEKVTFCTSYHILLAMLVTCHVIWFY